jgi:hypothetical protein
LDIPGSPTGNHSTGGDDALALWAVIGEDGTSPAISRTAPIILGNVLAPFTVVTLVYFGCWTLRAVFGLVLKRYNRLARLSSLLPRAHGIYGDTRTSKLPAIYHLAEPSAHPTHVNASTGADPTGSPSRTSQNTGRGGGNPSNGQSGRTGDTGSSRTVRTGTSAARSTGDVKIMYWNIFRKFTLKMTSTEFLDILKPYDIMVFAETEMLPGEDEVVDVPCGYSLVSLPRKPRLQTYRQGGGVALLIRDNIEFKKSQLTSPDILVLDLGSMWLIGAYIPPITSRWQGWTNVNPFEQLWETVGLCTRNQDKHVVVLADINGRIAQLQVPIFAESLPRISADDIANARGREII